MLFEYDHRKSQSNKAKHGIDFEEAQMLWKDDNIVQVPIWSPGEQWYLVIGKIDHKGWSAIITYREERIRIISVRRSRQDEVVIYEGRRN